MSATQSKTSEARPGPATAAATDEEALSTALAIAFLDGIGASDLAVRTQVAFVRALVDELDRRHRGGQPVKSLFAQLDEEVGRLRTFLARVAG